MTRINVGVSPQELPDKLLLAEHREITRIPNAIRRLRRINTKQLPRTFRLGEGHVRFFYDKQKFLCTRYNQLYAECVARGFSVQDKSDAFKDLPAWSWGDYSPSAEDRQVILKRVEGKGFMLV